MDMNCHEAIPLLSSFHDGELASSQRHEIAAHIASCAACSQRLDSIRRLSDLVESTPVPETPGSLVHRIEKSLAASAPIWTWWQFGLSRWSAVAAMLTAVAVLVCGLVVFQFTSPLHDHEEMVRVFGEFLTAFEGGRPDAEDILPQTYHGKLVTEAEATSALKRKTVARPVVFAKHQVASRYLLKMPCCDCVQSIYARDGQTSFVLFEHEKEQSEWFDARPMIRTECRGKLCCLVQLKNGLAATWPVEGGFVTVVGVDDVAELGSIVDELQPP
jgi:hypothetical protein